MGQGVFGHARIASLGQVAGASGEAGSGIRLESIEVCTFVISSLSGSSYGTEDPGFPSYGISASVH